MRPFIIDVWGLGEVGSSCFEVHSDTTENEVRKAAISGTKKVAKIWKRKILAYIKKELFKLEVSNLWPMDCIWLVEMWGFGNIRQWIFQQQSLSPAASSSIWVLAPACL